MSTILSADDLNDFIAPGVACIKPVEVAKTKETAEIQIGTDGTPLELSQDKSLTELPPAQISLTDCLACSGCITSSEALLVELQSPKELLKALEDKSKTFIVSICPQTRISLANGLRMTLDQVDARLRYLFAEKLGFRYMFGIEVARLICLEQEAEAALNSSLNSPKRPLLSSICPGWTVYAEKTHPHILPYLSPVRSPQQVTGNLAKKLVAKEHGINVSDIYHVSIMPCFDKKLEASRPDFEVEGAREVDIVVTAREILEMLRKDLDMQFHELPMSTVTTQQLTPPNWPANEQWTSNFGSSSGGYLAYVLSKAQQMHPGSEIVTVPGKNSDLVEYHVVANDQVVFRGAQVYGFRNIQNLVRKLKPSGPGKVSRRVTTRAAKSSDPHDWNYVEVMACPGGCINGGGQIAGPVSIPPKVFIEQLDELYYQLPPTTLNAPAIGHDLAQLGMPIDRKLVHTTYKPLQKDETLPAALTVGTQW